jgi:hypothetical protein
MVGEVLVARAHTRAALVAGIGPRSAPGVGMRAVGGPSSASISSRRSAGIARQAAS